MLTRDIRTRLEQMLPQIAGGLAALASQLRPSVARSAPRPGRRAFRAWAFRGALGDARTRGKERDTGKISLVGAGPGARDLLTLRAVERLQEADVVFYDRLVDEEVLELVRRDAERVFVGKHVGAHSWPQDRINRRIVTEAQKGKRVVRLKSGDPGIFGRATEEIDASRAAGIAIELVPGVTAASAAGAMMGQSLTQRDVTDTLVLTTGTGCASDPVPDSTRLSGPGTTTAFYMAVGQAQRLATDLMDKGLPADSPVDIACDVSKSSQRHIAATIGTLVDVLRREQVFGCAVLLVVWPKRTADLEDNQPFRSISAFQTGGRRQQGVDDGLGRPS